MKYDILEEFKVYLTQNLEKNTAKTYYSAVKNLLKDIDFNNLNQIRTDDIVEKIGKLRTKNQVSAAKNGLKHLAAFDSSFQLPEEQEFIDISIHKRNWVKSKGKKVDYSKVKRKVNATKNEKLKYAWRLAEISGLRVSELADLEPGDIKFREDGRIEVFVKRGKGGKPGNIVCLSDDYLYEKLKNYVLSVNEGKKIFYSESYLRENANKYGMQMHDFRRGFAIESKKRYLESGLTAIEANKAVKEDLRHSRYSTTKRYLYGRKLKLNGDKKPKIEDKGSKRIEYITDIKAHQ